MCVNVTKSRNASARAGSACAEQNCCTASLPGLVLEFNGSSSDRSRSRIVRHPRVTGSAGNGAASPCIPAHPVPNGGWRCVFTSSPFQTTTLEQTPWGLSSPCSQVGFHTLMGSPAHSPFFLPQFPQTNNPVVVKPPSAVATSSRKALAGDFFTTGD